MDDAQQQPEGSTSPDLGSHLSAQEITDLVVAMIAGRQSAAQAAERAQVPVGLMETWHRVFLVGGLRRLERAERPPSRELLLREQVESLKEALGEVTLEMSVWQDLADPQWRSVD